MKKILSIVLLKITLLSCCSKPAPDKVTSLQLNLTSKKDSIFFKNIKKIYAMGSNTNNGRFSQNTKIYEGSTSYYLELPISYAFDSTVYIFENKVQKNDTVIVYYKRNVSYDGADDCGYQQTLSYTTKQHYSTLKKYNLDVSFGTYGVAKGLYRNSDYSCTIKLYEK